MLVVELQVPFAEVKRDFCLDEKKWRYSPSRADGLYQAKQMLKLLLIIFSKQTITTVETSVQ